MEETNISIKEKNTTLGKIEIAPEVLEVISGVATHEVEGVYAMQGSFKSGVNELLGRSAHNKGVHLEIDENGLSVDIYCFIKYGASVPQVAMEIQQKVKEQILFMSDLEVSMVNVHVVGLVTPKEVEKQQLSIQKELGE
ncbi:Asp23/Gls24 family envelope stress response protein [Jeotgalibaca ciconiae]|uniref:Asp23/Gls24 family envelope stress response protein n=1 Tax=Jeotgalibaca ciconiae TaxID=2496265 RepID=A0A3Q9BMA0_9LACT|nr:Asp23/Gls24 family envelope stress response protein [Jeotgalibaca ciconiae]AZP05498.1 Asp23/Gls24 family envelope stress response protein [Jeotgalibaca ciconiae]HJB23683.1 Asp23/Gls24 family envelope stress response protein [Candidatus Jeotgalibaca pullicola]